MMANIELLKIEPLRLVGCSLTWRKTHDLNLVSLYRKTSDQ